MADVNIQMHHYTGSTWDNLYPTVKIANIADAPSSGFASKDDISSAHKAVTVTLKASSWSNNTQTVTVSGVTASNNVIVASSVASRENYAKYGVYCSAQSANKLTFKCSETPESNLTANVLIIF